MIQNIPEIFLEADSNHSDLFIYDFKMGGDVFKAKVNLSQNMLSFLQKGKKQVHFSDSCVTVDSKQSLLIKSGNCLWSELLDNDEIYYCKLFFFSDSNLKAFLDKHSTVTPKQEEFPSFFIIENDEYIFSYLNSLNTIDSIPAALKAKLLSVKFEELMLYLIAKYGHSFEHYLQSIISKASSTFMDIIEKNVYSNLKIEEIAFLCHMSLSTFKRSFIKNYNITPGKWFQDKRLRRAKELMEEGRKPSDVYMDLGYNNLSNFSAAFKNKFGKSPKLMKA